ncbi:MAG TPA: hypothetical protein VF538_10435 [Pyrinomonadaceae bacterium]|jgi:hypothetical protein
MQIQGGDNPGEETNAGGGQTADNPLDPAEEGSPSDEEFGVDPPIIIQGGGQPQN